TEVSQPFRCGYVRDFWWAVPPVVPAGPHPAGILTVIDPRRTASPLYKSAVHEMQFHFSRGTLRQIACESKLSPFKEFHLEPCKPVPDATMHRLGSSLVPAFNPPGQASRLFIDHVALAAACHMLQTYAGLHVRPARGGLAPWQQKRAEDVLAANLASEISLARIAEECRLSASHFARAFHETMGLPPHQWLLKRRVETAKSILRDSTLSLHEVALSCGFADQSHFTRTFSRWTGQGPGTWRRTARGLTP